MTVGVFSKIKAYFVGKHGKGDPDIVGSIPEEIAPEKDMPVPDGTASDAALLERIAHLRLCGSETVTRSFLSMHMYTFAAPMDCADMLNLVRVMRFLGFRLYSFGVEIDGRETPCESTAEFTRMLTEADERVSGCTLAASYSGARVGVRIDAQGKIQLTHDTSRPIDLAPFEELFVTDDMPDQ